MTLIPINRDPARWQLMLFAGMGCFALSWAGRAASYTSPALAYGLWAAAIVAGVVGLVRPRWLRRPHVALGVLAYPLIAAVSIVLLAGVYYLVMTPMGLALRIAGHDPLRRRPDETDSYWSDRKMEEDPERYFRPF